MRAVPTQTRASVPRASVVLLVALAVALAASGVRAQVIPIIDLHHNTATGQPAAPYQIGALVTVSGIVTVPDSVFSTYSTSIHIQDETGGINVFRSGGLDQGDHFALGDSVTLTGYIAFYNGLTEISGGASYGFTIHSQGHPLPAPLVMTCAELNDTFQADYSEPNESRLIRINNCTIVSGTWPTSPSGGNTLITINDGTENADLFIDSDSEVNGSPHPGDLFDVIGVLRQYDTTSPYTSGYEIVPRYVSDIIPFAPQGTVVDIDVTTATIYWETGLPATSVVQYGETDAYGQEISDPTLVTEHTVVLTDLSPQTLYHFRVGSDYGDGIRWDIDRLLHTAQSTPGELQTFFSHSVDHGYAVLDSAEEWVIIKNKVLERISAAEHSIDVMVYSFSLTDVASALISRFNSGVAVRVIVENDYAGTVAQQNLINAGVPLITSTYGGNHSSGGIHHNKVYIFDARDDTEATDDWIMTGSWNASLSGAGDCNNWLSIQDAGLAAAYTLEFNEQWGSDTDTPNAGASLFGTRKTDNTPHLFRIAGELVECYFSPSDAVATHIIDAIGTAEQSIYFCILSFTHNSISDAMRIPYMNIPDFEVRGVFDGESVGPITSGSEWYAMSGDSQAYDPWDPPADVWWDLLPGGVLLHHKYMLIDSKLFASDPQVVTGSANWSYAADQSNDENILILHSPRIANLYHQEFAERYHEAGGSGDIEILAIPNAADVLSFLWALPNPFPVRTTLRFALETPDVVSVRVFDAGGRLLRTVLEPTALTAGPRSVVWDGRDDAGRAVASGIYFVEVRTGAEIGGVKVLRLK